MELTELRFDTDKIKYDRKEDRITVEILDYIFIGHYRRSEKVKVFLRDVYKSLSDDIEIKKKDIYVFDVLTQERVDKDVKIKNLIIVDKEELERRKKEEEEKRKEAQLERERRDIQQVKRKSMDKAKIYRGKAGGKKLSEEKIVDFDGDGMALDYKDSLSEVTSISKQATFKSERKSPSKKRKKMSMVKSGPPSLPPAPSAMPIRPFTPKTQPSMPRPGSAPPSATAGSVSPIKIAESAPTSPPPEMELRMKSEEIKMDFISPSPSESIMDPSASAGPSIESPKKMLHDDDDEGELMEDFEGDLKEEIETEYEDEGIEPTTVMRKKKVLNMGMQYYSVIMEEKSYLFYVFISEKELIIMDEVGKTIYKTTFEIEITKPEPPRIHVKIGGKGFEIHPIESIIEIKDELKSQPTLIFSITALKGKKQKTKKEIIEGEKQYLHIRIEFEEKVVSHSVLAIRVQPKHFSLDIGPIHLAMSKGQAIIVSLIPVLISIISTVYTIMSMDFSGGGSGSSLEGLLPGAGSIIFLMTFIVTLLKKGVFPLKHKISGLMDMDKPAMVK